MLKTAVQQVRPLLPSTLPTTLHSFPALLPTRIIPINASFLSAPLRKDILHRAVVFERDALRQGTASSKTRAEVSGSTRKIRKQKGSGQARLGDRTSPMLRGGGRAHGPKPRDFSTELPRKVYSLALRTAFSYLRNTNALIAIDGVAELPMIKTAAAIQFLEHHGFSDGKKDNGRTLFILNSERKNLEASIGNLGHLCDVVHKENVLVSELLKYPRIIIEGQALKALEEMTRIE